MQQNGLSRGRLSLVGVFALYLSNCVVVPFAGADQIVLRDTTIIADRTVVGVSPDGVQLDDGSVYGWDRIDQGRVATEFQADFDRHLAELGPHLYRIRQRLRVGDYRDLLTAVEAVYPRFKSRVGATSYMVSQAAMWAYLARGNRVNALGPYLRCLEAVTRSDSVASELPGRRRLVFDRRTGMTPELAPIWFDATEAEKQLTAVRHTIQAMQRPLPEGVYIYYASLALCAGKSDQVERGLRAVRTQQGMTAEFKQVLAAQSEIQRGEQTALAQQLESQLNELSRDSKPLALYWLGMADLRSESEPTRKTGLLKLLEIPAVYGREQHELAAAALHRAGQELKRMDDASGSIALRGELLDNFGQTYFAHQARAAIE